MHAGFSRGLSRCSSAAIRERRVPAALSGKARSAGRPSKPAVAQKLPRAAPSAEVCAKFDSLGAEDGRALIVRAELARRTAHVRRTR